MARVLPLALSLAALAAPAVANDVLLVGWDAPDVQSAIDLAQDGDTVVVPSAGQVVATIDGKGLTLIAPPGVVPSLAGLVIRNVPASSAVLVRGFEKSFGNLASPWLAVTDCSGPVVLESVAAVDPQLAEVTNCSAVLFDRCELFGTTFGSLHPTLRVVQSRVEIYDSVVTGSNGFDGTGGGIVTNCTDGLPGQDALVVGPASVVRVAGSTLARGLGGLPPLGSVCWSGPDGDALSVAGGSRVDLIDARLIGDVTGGGTSVQSPGRSSRIEVPHHVGGGQSVRLRLVGEPGSGTGYVLSRGSGVVPLDPSTGTLWGVGPGLERRRAGVIPASGVLEFDLELPDAPFSGFESYRLQPIVVDATGLLRLGAPATLLLVGDQGPIVAAGRTVRVVDSGPTGGDGTTWPGAFSGLSETLARTWALPSKPPTTLWVAEGVHRVPLVFGQNRPFIVPRGVRLLGGFTTSTTDEADRDPLHFETVLSSDVLGDDGPGFTNRSDNASNVLITPLPSATAGLFASAPPGGTPAPTAITIDGFTVAGCEIEQDGFGAAVVLTGDVRCDRLRLEDCRSPSRPHVLLFGDPNFDVVDPTLAPPRLDRFSALGNIGRVLYLSVASQTGPVLVTSSLIAGNLSTGALVETFYGGARLENVTIAHNRVPLGQAAVVHSSQVVGQSTNLLHSIVFANSASGSSSLATQLQNAAAPGALRCDLGIVEGWDGATFPGSGTTGADPSFVDPAGPDGVLGTRDDDLRLRAGSPGVDSGDSALVNALSTLDLDDRPRIIDDPQTPDTGSGPGAIVDRGAYER
ncbi:MAG: hypothetical protein AAF726_11290 [Planctomycetota bacterium]